MPKMLKVIHIGSRMQLGLVEPSSSTAVVARFAGKWSRILNAVSLGKNDITNTDCTRAADMMYYIRFNKGWLPRQEVVEAGTSEIICSHTVDQPCILQPGIKLGTGNAPLIESELAKAQFTTTPLEVVNAADAANKAPEAPREPTEAVLEDFDDKQRASFIRLWRRVPPHLHDIQFDFEKALWTETDIDTLGDLLCIYEHRFLRHSADLGHVTVDDPFRTLPKNDARPVKQRPYRHFPVLAAKGANRNRQTSLCRNPTLGVFELDLPISRNRKIGR